MDRYISTTEITKNTEKSEMNDRLTSQARQDKKATNTKEWQNIEDLFKDKGINYSFTKRHNSKVQEENVNYNNCQILEEKMKREKYYRIS